MSPWPLTGVLWHRDGHGSPYAQAVDPPQPWVVPSLCSAVPHAEELTTWHPHQPCQAAAPWPVLTPTSAHNKGTWALGSQVLGGGQNIWEGQAISGQLFGKTPIQLFCRSLSPFTHSLVPLFIECLLCVSPCCRHWGCSMNKTDQPLPSKSCSQ